MSDEGQDGRRQRSLRSRERILEAIAKAISDPSVEITPEQIAAHAGVSMSTVFRHFGDSEGLATAMRERVAAQIVPLLSGEGFEGDTRTRLVEFLRRRAQVYEVVAPLQRASGRLPRQSEGAQKQEHIMAAAMTAQLHAALGPEFAKASDPHLAPLLSALLSLGSWTQLRNGEALGVEEAVAVLEVGVLRLLGHSA